MMYCVRERERDNAHIVSNRFANTHTQTTHTSIEEHDSVVEDDIAHAVEDINKYYK